MGFKVRSRTQHEGKKALRAVTHGGVLLLLALIHFATMKEQFSDTWLSRSRSSKTTTTRIMSPSAAKHPPRALSTPSSSSQPTEIAVKTRKGSPIVFMVWLSAVSETHVRRFHGSARPNLRTLTIRSQDSAHTLHMSLCACAS